MKRYVDTLVDDELDVAVAMALGYKITSMGAAGTWFESPEGESGFYPSQFMFHPTRNANQVKKIIEDEKISLVYIYAAGMWSAYTLKNSGSKHGADHTTAALRYFVYHKFGNEIDLPEVITS